MQSLYSTVTAMAVVGIYIVWQRYSDSRLRHERRIQERVTYMLWTMATQIH